MSAAGWARGRILVALALLAWLDDRGTTLGAATQADVDDWLDGATHYRYLLRDFLIWASARRPLPRPPPVLPRPLARTARRTPDPDPQTPPARNRAPPSRRRQRR
jgi:hypothetical protein